MGDKVSVVPGGFHTKMQLNSSGQAIFLREYAIFTDDDGNQKTAAMEVKMSPEMAKYVMDKMIEDK